MNGILRECEIRFGEPPRALGLGQKLRYRIWPPLWCLLSSDPLLEIYRDQNKLRDRGRIVWGHIVQANTLLFRPGRHTCPANVIYEPAPTLEITYDTLRPIAHSIFDLKGKVHDDEELDECARWVTDERLRMMNTPLPSKLTLGRPILFSTIMVHRAHLPRGYLFSPFFPLVVNPEETPAAMILPSSYWPEGSPILGT